MRNSNPTIETLIASFLSSIALSRSKNTARTYKNGMEFFKEILKNKNIDPKNSPITQLTEDAIIWMSDSLKSSSPTTERLYLTIASRFFEYLSAENLLPVNLPRVHLLIQQRSRRPGQRLPQFPQDNIIKIIDYADKLINTPVSDAAEKLINLRDRAFLITLADTGLRVHEACNLRRGDMEWNEGRAIIIGKGDQQAVVRFSRRSQSVLRDYLTVRAVLDGASGKPLGSLPLFARHDRGAGKKVMPITTATGRNIVTFRVREALGETAVGSITPHSFRHFFVTRVLQGSGNLKLAQELARHKNITVTQRYAHLSDNELDRGYWGIFEADGRSDDEH